MGQNKNITYKEGWGKLIKGVRDFIVGVYNILIGVSFLSLSLGNSIYKTMDNIYGEKRRKKKIKESVNYG